MELLLNACIGSLFVSCARDRVRADGAFPMPVFLVVLMFIGLVLVPATLYMYWAHSAWSWLYMVSPDDVPGLAVVPVIVAEAGALVGMWYLGARLIAADKGRVLAYVTAACGLLLVALTLAFSGRLAVYGSHPDYRDGTTAGLMDVKLGYVLIALILGTVAATAFVALELVRDSRRVRSR